MKRVLVISIALLICLGLALAGFGLWCLETASGTRWLMDRACALAGIELTTTAAEGTLFGGLELKGVRAAWPGGEVRADAVTLKIDRSSLWSGGLAIETLVIDRLVLQTGEESSTANGAQDGTASLALLPSWLEATIARLEINGFFLQTAATPTQQTVIANLLAGRFQLAGQHLSAEDFAYHSPSVELDGAFDWELTRPHLVLSAQVHLPETSVDPQLMASIRLPDTFPGHLEFTGDWNGYTGPVLFGVSAETGDTAWLSAQASGSWRGIRFDKLKGRYLGGTLAGTLDLSWSDEFRAHGDIAVQGLDPSAFVAGSTGEASFDVSGELRVPYDDRPLHARVATQLHKVQFRGHPLQGRAAAEWRGKTLASLDVDVTGDGARLLAKGVPEQKVAVDFAVADLAMFHTELAGSAAAGGWLSWADETLSGELSGHGENLAWRESRVRRVEFHGRHRTGEQKLELAVTGDDWQHGTAHLQRLAADLSGTLEKHRFKLSAESSIGQFYTAGTGSYRPGSWLGRLEQLTGEETPWGQWALTHVAPLAWQAGELSIDRLILEGGAGARVELSAKGGTAPLDADVSLSWTGFDLAWLQPGVDSATLSGLADGRLHYQASDGKTVRLGGHVSAEGSVTDKDFELNEQHLEFDFGWARDGLQLTGTLGSSSGEVVLITMASPGPPELRWPIDDLVAELQWQGLDLSRFNRFLDGHSAEGASEGQLSLHYAGGNAVRMTAHLSARGRMMQGERELGPRRLTADVEWDAERFQATATLLGARGGQASFQLSAMQAPVLSWPKSGEIDLSIVGLSLSALEPLMPTDIDVSGLFDGQATGTWKDAGEIDLTGRMTLRESQLSWSSEEGQIRLPLRDAVSNWSWSGERFSGDFSLNLAGQGELSGSWQIPLPARLPAAVDRTGKLSAKAVGRMQAIGILSAIGPWLVQDVRGDTRFNLALQGTLENPDLSGEIVFIEGGAYLPATGVQLENINLRAALANDRLRIEQLEIHSGPGLLNGQGELIFAHGALAEYHLEVVGKQFQAFDFPELQVICNPDLRLSGTQERLSLEGSVLLPVMAIKQGKATPEILPSKDVVMTTEERPRQALPFATDIQVVVELGDEVTFRASGVETRLGGGAVVTMGPTGEVLAQGEIQLVEGSYSAYGVRLKIRQGVLNYRGGAITNPNLRIFAAREVGSVLAGVQVTGNVEAPVVTLYSQPTMPERDILGYILMGRAVKAESQEMDMLLMGAGTLLPNQGEGLAAKLGITEIDIQGLFEGTGGVKLRRQFAEKWELESTLGMESGIDLYYIIEFD